jgi:DNA polymerase III epsilon subunit-like protein
MLKDAPTTREVLEQMIKFIEIPNNLLIAHNGTRFDHKILCYWIDFYDLQIKNALTFVDSLDLCRKQSNLMPSKEGKLILNQDEIHQHLFGSLPLYIHHAFFDVWTLTRILLYLAQYNLSNLNSLFLTIIQNKSSKKSQIHKCNCTKGCQTLHCSCRKESMVCNDSCGCKKIVDKRERCQNLSFLHQSKLEDFEIIEDEQSEEELTELIENDFV